MVSNLESLMFRYPGVDAKFSLHLLVTGSCVVAKEELSNGSYAKQGDFGLNEFCIRDVSGSVKQTSCHRVHRLIVPAQNPCSSFAGAWPLGLWGQLGEDSHF